MVAIIIVIALIVIIGAIVAGMYNGLVRLNIQADEAWSDITVQLKRRYDLIPNLVNSVKGYATHEKSVFEEVTRARSEAVSAANDKSAGVKEQAAAENAFQSTLRSLFAVAENYPDLKANQNFLDLQAQLTDTEDKIQNSRRFYNGVVRDFNTKRKTFPTNLLAGMLGFRQDREFFELDDNEQDAAQKPVEVKF